MVDLYSTVKLYCPECGEIADDSPSNPDRICQNCLTIWGDDIKLLTEDVLAEVFGHDRVATLKKNGEA